MTTNIGSTDRLLRLVVGLALLSLVVLLEGNVRWIGLVGIVPLATAFLRWCPAYTLFGIDTCAPRDRVAPQG
jgi:hypothetical protein